MSTDASLTGAGWQGIFDKKLRKINNLSSHVKYLQLDHRGLKLLRVKGKRGRQISRVYVRSQVA